MESIGLQGPLAFYKGFIPNFGRLGSWNVIMFLTLEQVQVTCPALGFRGPFFLSCLFVCFLGVEILGSESPLLDPQGLPKF